MYMYIYILYVYKHSYLSGLWKLWKLWIMASQEWSCRFNHQSLRNISEMLQ